MNKDEFLHQFREAIRVNVDWKLFKDDSVQLQQVRLQLPGNLNRLWTPWFPGGTSHHSSDPSAPPLSVLGAASDLTLLGSHQEGVRKWMARIDDEEFEAPAVAFPRNRYLLLDGNHHAVAAAVREERVALTLWAIVPPTDQHILVDLPALD